MDCIVSSSFQTMEVRMSLDGKLLIDHDGNHPPKPAGGLTRLQKGLHPLRIEYFQGNGELWGYLLNSARRVRPFHCSRQERSLLPSTSIQWQPLANEVTQSEHCRYLRIDARVLISM